MEPFERFKKLNTEGNLWIYVLSLGQEGEVLNEKVRELIFERFGFLPPQFLIKRVLFRLKNQGFLKTEKYLGKTAFLTTQKGKVELEKMKQFCQELLAKI